MDVPTGIGEGKVKLTGRAKNLRIFANLLSSKKKKLLSKSLGGRIWENFEDIIEEPEEKLMM